MNIKALARESLALLLAGVVAALALALFSYTPADPSLNHQTTAAVSNMVGLAGAYAADFLYQLFGYAAWLWVILLLLVAIRMAWGKT
ncbi:MAG: DNA translocase FtsK 4TM domain-containing protein, partial [Mariprofundaceae bacterium]